MLVSLPGVAGAAPAPAPSAGGDWLAGAQRAISEREYEASWDGEGLQAPNRAHDLRTHFEPWGIRVVDRTAAGSPELLALRLRGMGRGEALSAVPPGEVASEGARVEIRRPGLVEWYENAPAGLEQGFTLAAPPQGTGPLVLELLLSGAAAVLAGDALVLRAATGRRLHYGGLVVVDATGRAFDAQLALPAPDRLRLVVEEAGAVYPLTLDPLLTTTADSQLEGGQSGAFLGTSVASAGDVNGDGYADVIIGAPFFDAGQNNEGAAFVFLGSATGIADGSSAAAATQLESDQVSAQLGVGVASAGDVNGDGYADVIVGAPFYDAGESDEGAAFVFLGSGSGIADGSPAAAAAQLESDQMGGRLGRSVASAGDVNGDGYADVIVGASDYDAGEAEEGAAFVFLGSAAGIVDGDPGTAAAQLESDQEGAFLGTSVSSAGDVDGDGYADVIVGAPLFDAGESEEGAAFVFLGSAAGIVDGDPGTAAAQLETDQPDAQLGGSVASAGDVNGDGYADVIAGAPGYDAGESAEGAAFVFLGSAAGIVDGDPDTAAAQLESDQMSAQFGASVGSAGDVNGDGYADVIVGARLFDAGQADEGAVFVFLGSAAGVTDGSPGTAAAQLEVDQAGAQLGGSVAGAGDVDGDGYADVVAGAALFESIPENSSEGGAFVFLGGAAGISASASAQLESDQGGAGLGSKVASAGDVNGDGFADVVVGAPFFDAGQADEGAAFVFLGGAAGVVDGDPATAAQLEGDQAGAQLGTSVASAGDVDGDGYADVIAGAPFFDAGQSNEGGAFVFLGSPTGVVDGGTATAATQLEGDQAGAQLGASVASAGDVNGDGFADVIAGAPGYDAGQIDTNDGAAFVFHGSATGIADASPATAAAELRVIQLMAGFGASVASAGDVDGDGYADVVVGAPDYDAGQSNEGAAFVFLGSAAGIGDNGPATANAQLESDQSGAGLGASVASAGDVDGDGHADVIVGAPLYDAGENDEGAAFVFLGSAAGIGDGSPSTADAQLESDQADAQLGASVASAGDVNGDGLADVIAGAPGYDAGESEEGAAFVFLGSSAGIPDGSPATADVQLESDQADAGLGSSVASAGDVDGDGFADVITGAPGYDAGENEEGAAFVFLGNGGGGRDVVARQLRGGASSQPVQPWGSSEAPDEFEVGVTATHPEGRARVKLEIERCGPGTAFGAVGCTSFVSSSWSDVGAASSGVTLTETIPIPFGQVSSRWRARVLRAPFSVTETGITAPPNPAHGPWRRLFGQAVEADLQRQMLDAVVVAAGLDSGASALGGAGSWGGVDASFADTTGGTLSVAFVPAGIDASLDDLLPDPAGVEFRLPSVPLQTWDLGYDGSFSGVVTLTFQYSQAGLIGVETDLQVEHFSGGSWSTLPKMSQDTVANTITVTTSSLSPFVLSGGSSVSSGWRFSGTAQGGSFDFTVGAVFLSVTTTSGQTAVEVAGAVAAAINANATLMAAGIGASAAGPFVQTNGAIGFTEVNDPGILPAPLASSVPALHGGWLALLASCLLVAALFALRRSAATTD